MEQVCPLQDCTASTVFPSTERKVVEGMHPSKLTVGNDAEALFLLANALQVHMHLQGLPV